jgi:MSHA biogenesis protein MshO
MRRISDKRAEAPTYFTSHWLPERGFTLIEALVVIMITGIIAVAVITFVREPILAYLDTARRAELSDEADTALRRIARDVQSALPNSVRVSGTAYLEFLPVRSAGRYRADFGVAGAGDPLDFTSSTDSSFDVLGPTVTVAAGDSIVVYNLGITGAEAYKDTLTSRRLATAAGNLAVVQFNPNGTAFPSASPGSRFQVISTPVTYACDLGTGRLLRYAGYPITDSQPSTLATLNALVAPTVLANNLTDCSFTYNAGALVRSGVVAIRLAITRNGETVIMLHQVSVSNTP